MNYKKVSALLSLLPILYVGFYIYRFGLNFPFYDQWGVVAHLMDRYAGKMSFFTLMSQANEHRPFFPRLIWLALAQITNYDVRVELWVNLFIFLILFIFFILQAIKTWRSSGIKEPWMIIPLLALLLFNLGQYESWLQGIQTLMFLGIACMIMGFFLLAENPDGWRNFWLSLLLGIIAHYSMVSGMMYWVIGMGIIIFSPHRFKTTKIIIWLLIASICILFYFQGWKSKLLDTAYIFNHLSDFFIFIINFLGAPVNATPHWAWLFGCIGSITILYTFIVLVKTNQWKQVLPYLAIILFILINALITSTGRITLGIEQARVSRYHTVSVWYWASLIVLLSTFRIKNIYQYFYYGIITVSLMIQMYLGTLQGQVGIYQRILPVYEIAKVGLPLEQEILTLIYPKPELIGLRLQFLIDNKLSVFGE